MTRYARALGSKSSNARVHADPTPWSEMAPIKTPIKRAGLSIDADDSTTPKKEKKTPAKKTPKVVKLGSGMPMLKSPVQLSSPLGTPVSTKKGMKKTPSAFTPANTTTPQAGKMSGPSPLMTRSQRRRKSVLNATIGTPNTKNVSPAKKTPGDNNVTPKAGDQIGMDEKMEEGDDDLKLQLDSDDDEEMDSDDIAPDEGIEDEPEDDQEKEMRAAELKAILSKPASRKSILKMNTDSPKTPGKVQLKTIVDDAPATPKAAEVTTVNTEKSTPVKASVPATPKSKKKGAKAIKSPAEKQNEKALTSSPVAETETTSGTPKIEEVSSVPSSTPLTPEQEKRKAKKKAVALARKARRGVKQETIQAASIEPKSADENIFKLMREIKKEAQLMSLCPEEKQLTIKTNEELYEKIRQELHAQGKSDAEVDTSLSRIRLRMMAKLKYVRCLRCRKMGHFQKDCPTAKVDIMCYKCGDANHRAKACSIQEEVYTFAECYICHQKGHLTKTCPSNKNGVYPNGGSCHKCQENTHFAKDCPTVRGIKKEQDENAKPLPKKQFVGMRDITDKKQSADADDFESLDEKQSTPAAKKGKKQVVKF